jgi:hypothetical protein
MEGEEKQGVNKKRKRNYEMLFVRVSSGGMSRYAFTLCAFHHAVNAVSI